MAGIDRVVRRASLMGALWTVEARNPNASEAAARGWTAWTEWVDRATAESELAAARAEGYHARIVRAASRDGVL